MVSAYYLIPPTHPPFLPFPYSSPPLLPSLSLLPSPPLPSPTLPSPPLSSPPLPSPLLPSPPLPSPPLSSPPLPSPPHARYCLLADYEAYIRCQERVSKVYKVCATTGLAR